MVVSAAGVWKAKTARGWWGFPFWQLVICADSERNVKRRYAAVAIVNVVPSNTMTLIRYVIVFVLDSINGSVSFFVSLLSFCVSVSACLSVPVPCTKGWDEILALVCLCTVIFRACFSVRGPHAIQASALCFWGQNSGIPRVKYLCEIRPSSSSFLGSTLHISMYPLPTSPPFHQVFNCMQFHLDYSCVEFWKVVCG